MSEARIPTVALEMSEPRERCPLASPQFCAQYLRSVMLRVASDFGISNPESKNQYQDVRLIPDP